MLGPLRPCALVRYIRSMLGPLAGIGVGQAVLAAPADSELVVAEIGAGYAPWAVRAARWMAPHA